MLVSFATLWHVARQTRGGGSQSSASEVNGLFVHCHMRYMLRIEMQPLICLLQEEIRSLPSSAVPALPNLVIPGFMLSFSSLPSVSHAVHFYPTPVTVASPFSPLFCSKSPGDVIRSSDLRCPFPSQRRRDSPAGRVRGHTELFWHCTLVLLKRSAVTRWLTPCTFTTHS